MATVDLGTAQITLYPSPGAFGLTLPLAFPGTSLATINNGAVYGVAIDDVDPQVAAFDVDVTEPEIRGASNLGGRPTVSFGLRGTLSVALPPVVPPVGLAPLYIRRRSPIMPTVVGRNGRGEPIT